jgi:hypothetical protein
MYNSLKIIKTLSYFYSSLHVWGILTPIIRSLLILHIQPPVIVCHWVGCIFQLWSVTTVAFVSLWGGITLLYSYYALHVSGTLAPIIRNLLILHIQPPVTVCRWVVSSAPQTHESDSSDRPKLEDTTNPTTNGDWRLYVQS